MGNFMKMFFKESLSTVALCAQTMPEKTALTGLWLLMAFSLASRAGVAIAAGEAAPLALSLLGTAVVVPIAERQIETIRRTPLPVSYFQGLAR